MSVKDRVTPAATIIAEWLGCDINEVTEMVYQPTTYRSPRIFAGDDNPWSYYCCPTARQKLPAGFQWEIAGYSWRSDRQNRPIWGVRHSNTGV